MRKILLLLAALCALAAPSVKASAAPVPPLVKKAANTIMSGKIDPIKNDLTPQMKAGLTPQALQAVKTQIAPLGALKSVTVVGTQIAQGYKITTFKLSLAKGTMIGTLAQDKAGKIAGLYVKPAA